MGLPCLGAAPDDERAKQLRKDLPIVAHEFSIEELKSEYGIKDFALGLTTAQVGGRVERFIAARQQQKQLS